MRFTIVCAAIAAGAAAFGSVIYVAPDGDDANSGTMAQPLRTPHGARDHVRKLRKSDASCRVEVVFADGRYTLSKPLALDGVDGGDARHSVVWRAANRGGAVFSGEMAMSSPKQDLSPRVMEMLPPVARGKVCAFELPKDVALPGFQHADCGGRGVEIPLSLFQCGRRLESARWPNDGYAKTGANIGENKFCHDSTMSKSGRFAFSDKARIAAWAKEPDLWAYGLWNYQWADAKTKVVECDPEKGEMAVDTGPLGFGIREKGGLFCVFNALSELDRPGEWVLDRKNRRLYVWPLDGARDFTVAFSAGLVSIRGAENVVFDGFVFEYSRQNAVRIVNSTNCAVVASVVRHTSESGIDVSGGRGNIVKGCDLYDLGEGGVNLGGGELKNLHRGDHVAENNHIHHFGELVANYRPGVRLSGVGCRAVHNLIHHTRHQAVSFYGNDHDISWNVIHDAVCYNSDAGAIYCCQRDWRLRGTVIEHNLIHYTGNRPKCGNCDAIYLDDNSSGNIVRYNVVNRANRGVHIGGGQDNLVEKNVFINCKMPLYLGGRGLGSFPNSPAGKGRESWMFKMLEKDRDIYLGEFWRMRYPRLGYVFDIDPVAAHDPHYTIMRDNLLVGCGKVARDVSTRVWNSICGTSSITNNVSLASDPGFADYQGFDWNLKEGTAARKLVGDMEVSKMGLYDSPDRISAAVKFSPDVTPAPGIGIME